MNNLLSRTLSVGIAAILSFALVTALVIQVGFRSVVDRADRQNQARVSDYIAKRLANLEVGDGDAGLGAQLAMALAELPARTEYLAVADDDGRPLYMSKKDKPLGERQWNSLQKQLGRAAWTSAKTADSSVLWFTFKTTHIDMEESSQTLIGTIEQIAVMGAAIALVVAAAVSFLVSRPLSGQARALASALAEMQGGKRDVELPLGGMKEMREIAASAAKLQEGLRQEEALRGQWTADIAHDLRTPLAVLKGQLEGMIDGVLDSGRGRLERNYEEVLKLERLVNQLADLTRIESPGYKPDLKEIDAAGLLSAQARRFEAPASERNMTIAVDCGAAPGAAPKADAALLERALANLVDNAIRYGEPGSELKLGLDRGEGDSLRFIVDNAGLVDPADRPHVFDRLYRGDRSRSSPGSGIGLSIARAAAIAHKGTLSLECDEASRRTRFILSLPA